MGITGLLPFLESSTKKCYINEFRGLTVAIDSYCWLHKGTFSCADKIVRGEHTDAYVKYCFKYINLLRSCNIKPILVFDGQHLPAKQETERRRHEHRSHARNRATELLRLGKMDEARQYFRQCVNVTHEMALALIKECRRNGIDCIVAPYEADAQLTYLNKCGIADFVITEDSDLILFGCSKILFKFNLDGSGILVEHHKLNDAMKMRPDQYTFDKFRYMCIMSGCDYLDSLPGIGLKKAFKAISLTHNPDIYKLLPRLPRYLKLSKLVVTEQYIENFKLADATIKHQIVYDPIKRKQVPLNDPKDCDTSTEYLKNAGTLDDSEKAFEMAVGNIDPISLKVMDNWNPDGDEKIAKDSIWSKGYTKSFQKPPSAKPTTMKVKKNVALSSNDSQEMLYYEKKLEEELKVYHRTESPPKRMKVNEHSPPKEKVKLHIHNPFLKQKSLSKFGSTCIDYNKIVVSRFFKQPTETPVSTEEDTCVEMLSCNTIREHAVADSDSQEPEDTRLSPILNKTTDPKLFRRQFLKSTYKHSVDNDKVSLSDTENTQNNTTGLDADKLTSVSVEKEVIDFTTNKTLQNPKERSIKKTIDLTRFRKRTQPTISCFFNNMKTQS
ncbi:hypothetical protein RI129_012029 [Pyrocoelia pectoralis]|uniref:Exonuclease 1 n=1 Tax=Pyrocoelia pectoralis TaxID=417401 RepID=A0AAN7V1J6_9COLE